MSSILVRMGGKHYMKNYLCDVIQQYRFGHYVEIFAGALHVYFELVKRFNSIGRKTGYTINDKDSFIFNFYKQLQDNPVELKERLNNTTYSRELFGYAKQKIKDNSFDNDIDKAVYYFIFLMQSFNGEGSWSYTKDPRISNKRTRQYRNKLDEIEYYNKLLKYAQVENQDFRKIIKIYDSDETLFYADPPYYGTEHYYDERFTEQDHADLAELLNSCKATVVLSYYDCELIDKYYKEWKIERVNKPKSSQRVENGNSRTYVDELVLIKNNNSKQNNNLNQYQLWE